MIYPIVDPKVWAARYGLTWGDCYCLKCGRKIELSIPFAFLRFRGLISRAHKPCGKEFRQSVFVSMDSELKKVLSIP